MTFVGYDVCCIMMFVAYDLFECVAYRVVAVPFSRVVFSKQIRVDLRIAWSHFSMLCASFDFCGRYKILTSVPYRILKLRMNCKVQTLVHCV